MQKNIVLLCLVTLLFLSCKKDKNVDVPTPIPVPLEKAIIGKWAEYQNVDGSPVNNIKREYHFLNDTLALFKFDIAGIVCTAKYSIKRDIYPEILGYIPVIGIPGQCNSNDVFNLKMLEITDSTFKASRSRYTGIPPNYFIDDVSKYRKFQ